MKGMRRNKLAIENCFNLIYINQNYPNEPSFGLEDDTSAETSRDFDSCKEVGLLLEYEDSAINFANESDKAEMNKEKKSIFENNLF